MKFCVDLVLAELIRPAPHGAGGLKYILQGHIVVDIRPAPHGAGGLKYRDRAEDDRAGRSRPPRGGWIEMFDAFARKCVNMGVPPPTGRVD